MKLNYLAFVILFFAACSHVSLQAIAQDENSEDSQSVENAEMTIVASDDGSGGPPVVISAMSSSINGQPAVFSFSSPSGANFLNLGGAIGPMGPMNPIDLLHNADVQKEIELDSDQMAEFKNLTDEFQKQMQEHSGALRKGKLEPETLKEMAAKMKSLKDEQTTRLKKLLVPHQLERLQQISTQQFMESAGTANALASKQLAEQLGLTKDQIENLKKRSEEVNKELQEKMEVLRAEAREKILNELTAEQKAKIQTLMGKKYTSKMPEFEGLRRRIRSSKTSPQENSGENK